MKQTTELWSFLISPDFVDFLGVLATFFAITALIGLCAIATAWTLSKVLR